VTGSIPNITPPDVASSGWTSTAIGSSAAPAGEASARHRDRERIEATYPDHRFELPGHRRVRRVLDDRRAPRQ
jgi:hypothetical protein